MLTAAYVVLLLMPTLDKPPITMAATIKKPLKIGSRIAAGKINIADMTLSQPIILEINTISPVVTSKSPACGRVKIPHLWPG